MSAETDQNVETLRARVAELERQLAEQSVRTNRAIAEAQERAYWLDRWHIDLNALMATENGARFRAGMRTARGPIRRVRVLKRRFFG